MDWQPIGKSGNLSKDLTQNSKNSAASVFIGFAFLKKYLTH